MVCNDAIAYVNLLFSERPTYDPASEIGAGLLVTAKELCESAVSLSMSRTHGRVHSQKGRMRGKKSALRASPPVSMKCSGATGWAHKVSIGVSRCGGGVRIGHRVGRSWDNEEQMRQSCRALQRTQVPMR